MRLLPTKRPAACSIITTAQRLLRWVTFPTVFARSFASKHSPSRFRQHADYRPGTGNTVYQRKHLSSIHASALSSSSSSSASVPVRLLALTPQSFKLADLYCLAASLERWPGSSTTSCERLLVDSGTGSALLRLDVEPDPQQNAWVDAEPSSSSSSPIFLQHCEWVGRVLASGRTPTELLHQIRTGYPAQQGPPDAADAIMLLHWTDRVRHPWTLQYVCLGDQPTYERQSYRPHTANMLLCATAQAMGQPAPRRGSRSRRGGAEGRRCLRRASRATRASSP